MTERNNQRNDGMGRTENRSSVPNDLPDSPSDRERLEPEETYINLPDVKDIPGQEFVNAPPVGSLSDTTISSADEEGDAIFADEGDDDDDTESTSNEFDVTPEERTTLSNADYMPTTDEDNLRRAALDNTDFDGDPLEEKGFGEETSGDDLDVPNDNEDPMSDPLDVDDEENKNYSLGSSDNDNVTEGTP